MNYGWRGVSLDSRVGIFSGDDLRFCTDDSFLGTLVVLARAGKHLVGERGGGLLISLLGRVDNSEFSGGQVRGEPHRPDRF